MVLKILPTHALFRALIAKGRVMSAKAREHLPVDVLAALVKANIMALHPDGAYTVHARHVESFLRGQVANLGLGSSRPTAAAAEAAVTVAEATDAADSEKT